MGSKSKPATGAPRVKRHKYLGFYDTLDATKVNPFASLVANEAGVVPDQLDASSHKAISSVDDLTLQTQDDQTYLVTQHGITRSEYVYGEDAWTKVQQATNVARFHASIFGQDTSNLDEKGPPPELPQHLAVTYSFTALETLETQYRGIGFLTFARDVKPFLSTLPTLLSARDQVYQAINLFFAGTLADVNDIKPVITFTIAVIRDLASSLSAEFVCDFTKTLALILCKHMKDVQVVTIAFHTLAQLLYWARATIVADFEPFLSVFMPGLLLHPKEFVRQFAGEGLAYVLRSLPLEDLANCMEMIIRKSRQQTEREAEETNSGVNDVVEAEETDDEDGEADESVAASDESGEVNELGDEDARRVVDLLSVISFEVVKSIDNSLVLKKALWFIQFWMDLALGHSAEKTSTIRWSDYLIGLTTLQTYLARLKAQLQSWTHVQMTPLIEHLENSIKDADSAKRELLLRLFVGLLGERPRLYDFCQSDLKEQSMTYETLSDSAKRVLKSIQTLLTGTETSMDCKTLSLLTLMRGLPRRVLDPWLAASFPQIFIHNQLSSKGDATVDYRRLGLLFERLLAASSTGSFGEGLDFEERHVTTPLFQITRAEPLFPQVAAEITLLVSKMLRPKCSGLWRLQLLALAPKALVVSSPDATTAIMQALRKVEKRRREDGDETCIVDAEETRLVSRAFRMMGDQQTGKSIGSLADIDPIANTGEEICAKMELIANSLTSENVAGLIRDGLRLFCDSASLSISLSGWLREGRMDERCLLMEALYVQMIQKHVSDVHLDETDKLVTYLVSTLRLPSLSLCIASLRCLRVLLSKSEGDETCSSSAKKRKTETVSLDTLFDLCEELIAKPNTFDSASSKTYLIARIGEEAERHIGKTSGSNKTARLIAVSVLMSQTTSTFTPLWTPAITALTTLYKRGTDEYIIGMIWASLAACLTARLRAERVHGEAFVLPQAKRKMKSKVDSTYFTGAIPYDTEMDNCHDQLVQAWTRTAHLDECKSICERETSQMLKLALYAPQLKPSQSFGNLCNLFASLISALTLGQRIAPHSSLQMRSIAQVVAEAVCQIGTCLMDEHSACKKMPGLDLQTSDLVRLSSVMSNRDKGEIMNSLLVCMAALKPLETQKLSHDVKVIFEAAAVVCIDDLLSLPHPALQESIVGTFASLKISAHEELPLLSKFFELTGTLVESLKGLCSAGKRFKSKLQDLGDLDTLLHPTEKDLGLDCLVHLCFSHLALKGGQGKGSDRHLIISVLSSMDRSRVSLLVALMLSRLFSNETLARSTILRNLRAALSHDEVLSEWVTTDEGVTLQVPHSLPLSFDICNKAGHLSRERDIIKRVSGFLSLLKSLLMHFRQKIIWLVPFLSSLLSHAIRAVNAETFFALHLTDLRRHLIRDLLKSVYLVFDLYPTLDHTATLTAVYPVLEMQLIKSVTGPSAFGASAAVKFVTNAAKKRHTLFVLASRPKLLQILLEALVQDIVLKALRDGKTVALVTEALGVMKALWRFVQGAGRQVKRKRRVKANRKNDRDDDSDSSGDEETATLTLEVTQEQTTAKKLIEDHLQILLKGLRELVMAKRGDGRVLKTSIVSQEIGLLIDFADLPQMQKPEAAADRELARDLFVLLMSAVPPATHKDQAKHTAKITKLAQASLPLVPSLSDVVSDVDGSLFTRESHVAKNNIIRTSVDRCMSLLVVITDATCQQALAELIVSLTLTQHTKTLPLTHLTALRTHDHPTKVIAAGKEPIEAWHPDKLKLTKKSSSTSQWDVFFAHVVFAICCRSTTDFSNAAGDPEVQVAVIGALIDFGFVDGIEKSLRLWPSLYLEPMAKMILHLGSHPSLDLGVATVVDKFWMCLFKRLSKLGQVRRFVLEKEIDAARITDIDHWQGEMEWAISMAQTIPENICTFATSALSSQVRPLVSIAIQLLNLVVSCLAPFAPYLPRHSSTSAPLDFFKALEPEESLSGSLWLMEDLLPFVTYEESILQAPSSAHDPVSLQSLWLEASTNIHTDHLDDAAKLEPSAEFSVLLNLLQMQRVTKVASFKILRFALPRFTKYTISKIVIPLAVLETVQKETMSGDQHHGPLSEEALSCLTAALKLAAWSDLVTVIQILARLLPKSKKTGKHAQISTMKETVVIRAISRLVGCVTYQFDLLKQQVKDGDETAITRLQKNTSSLKRVLIPVLRSLTMPEPIYVRGVAKEQPVRPEAVAAMLQAASQLSKAEFEALLPPLIHNLALTLKAKLYQDRKNGRVALRYYVQTLGPKCLPRLIKDLHARLNKGMATASLTVGVSQLIQTLLPVGKKHAARKMNAEDMKALREAWPSVMQLIVSELDRIANPNDHTMDIQLDMKRKLEETRRKKQEPELSRVEGPTMVACLSAYATAEGLGSEMIPSLMSLLNPSTVLKKSGSISTSTFSSKYLRRTNDLVRAAFTGIENSAHLTLFHKYDLLRSFTEVAIGLILEEGQSREVALDFTQLDFKSLYDLFAVRQHSTGMDREIIQAVMKALGKPTTKPRGLDLNKYTDLQKAAQAKRDAHYAVQPGAPTGTAAKRSHRTVYGDAMQGRQMGSYCFKTMDALLPQLSALGDSALSAEGSVVSFNALCSLCISAFISHEEEWRALSGSCVLRLQKIIINAKQKSLALLLPRLQAVSDHLSDNGKAIAEQVLRVFSACPTKPTFAQSKRLLVASGLIKFYVTDRHGLASAAKWMGEKPSKEARSADVKGCIRAALLAHINHMLSLPYHATANQSLKVAALQLLINLMDHKPKEGIANKYSNDELETLYAIADELVRVLTQQAGYGMSYGQKGESNLVQTARWALVTFMKRFPLKEKAFDAKINKLLAQLNFPEAEGRRSVMNTIACLIREVPVATTIKRIAVPLWLTGVKRLPLELRTSLERQMLSTLLMKVLELDSDLIPSLLELSSQTFRDDPAALLASTSLLFRRLAVTDYQSVSLAQVTKALLWTAGVFSMHSSLATPLQTADSQVLQNLRVPILSSNWREIALSVVDVFEAIVSSDASPRFKSWLSEKEHVEKNAKFAPSLAALIVTVGEGLTLEASLRVLRGEPLRRMADLIERGLAGNGIFVCTVGRQWPEEWKRLRGLSGDKSLMVKREGNGLSLREVLSLRAREAFVESSSSVFDLYASGLGELCLSLVASSAA